MNGKIISQEIQWLTTTGRQILSNLEAGSSLDGLALEAWQKSLLVSQLQFRVRAARRLPTPELWTWTEKSLSQASDWCSATFKASLFPIDVPIIDACCGAGVDLYALGKCVTKPNSDVQLQGIDIDADMVELCNCNMRQLDSPAIACQMSFSEIALDKNKWLHIDPDRRSSQSKKQNSKTIVAEEFSPSWSEICEVARKIAGAVVKLSPKTTFEDDQTSPRSDLPMQSLWIGNRGECRQQLALLGEASNVMQENYACCGDHRVAVLVETPVECDQTVPSDLVFADTPRDVPTGMQAGEFIYDLHATLHASELAAAWGDAQDLRALGARKGYYTGEHLIKSPWLHSFRVIEQLAWDDRKIRKCLRRLDAGIVEVKNRLHRMDAGHMLPLEVPEAVVKLVLETTGRGAAA